MAAGDPDPRSVRIPHGFLRKVLARTEDLAELKVILYVASVSAEIGRRAVPREAVMHAEAAHAIAGEGSPEPAEARARRALDRAVVNGSLLQLSILTAAGRTPHYLTATDENREAVERFRRNDAEAARSLGIQPGDEVEVYRPNIFGLYERAIGPLTPLVAEQLRDAERSYPRDWIEQAMQEASEREHHSWKYVEAILTRWEAQGGPRRSPVQR
jgi:DnaD/phage-associated family protein